MDKGTGFGDVESVSGIFELVVSRCRGEEELVEGMASSRLGLILRSLTPSALAWLSGGAFAFLTFFSGLPSLFLLFVLCSTFPGSATLAVSTTAFDGDSPDPRKSLSPDLEGVRFCSPFLFPIASFTSLLAFFFPIPPGGFILNS